MADQRFQFQTFMQASSLVIATGLAAAPPEPTSVTLSSVDQVVTSDTPRFSAQEALLAEALIEKIPGVVGGSAHVARTRVAVWTLARYRALGASEDQILAAFPALRLVDLKAAWQYVALNHQEIERDIAENETV